MSEVSGGSRVMQHTCDSLTCGAGGRDSGREGQGLQYCMHCKCSVKPKISLPYFTVYRSSCPTFSYLHDVASGGGLVVAPIKARKLCADANNLDALTWKGYLLES